MAQEKRLRDRDLGMDRSITRRDFLHGVGAVVAGTMAGGAGCAEPAPFGARAPAAPGSYPPAETGLRGSQPGSYEVAHQLAREGRRDFGPLEDDAVELYDLVVVGGGLSGLAAAWFYRREHPDARILILDNHDDFGGHARRNEFRSGGRTLIGHGGSQSLEEPDRYGASTKRLLRELGIETPRFHDHYDRHFFRRHGLGLGFFFDRETYGVDRLVRTDMANPLDDEYAPSPVSQLDAVQQMPISEAAQRALRRVTSPAPELFRTAAGEWHVAFLQEITYLDYLRQRLGVDDPEVTGILNGAAVSAFADSIDNIAAWDAVTWGGLPGLPEELRKQVFSEAYVSAPYIFHFPDGNASVARLLVASLVPGVVGGEKLGMDTVVTARFDYSRLDEAGSAVRLRLESTAVRVEHHGSPASAKRVAVTYVRRGRARRVWGKACVMACYNVMIPHLCPELPAEQRQSLGDLVRAPLVYTSVLLRDWQPWKRAGLGLALCPGSYHQVAMLDFPVSMGGYRFASGPDQPIIAHLEGSPLHPGSGLTRRQQYRAARAVMLNTPFESIERSIRLQLGGMLGAFGLDPARDIEGITVNRWAHGYAYGYQPLVDAEEFEGELPHVVGRRRFGRVTIACSDAGAFPSIDSAITQAHRAVQELA